MNITPRIYSIDLLRGLVMALMTVDHVREFFFFAVPLPDPMDVMQVDPATFFTRWLAHFCAPVFVFLTGLSAYLHASRRELNRKEISLFLLKRGLLLMLLEVTLISFAWTFTFPPEQIFLQVIWAIGVSMVCLSGIVWLPWKAIVAVGAVIVLGHNMLDPLTFTQGTAGYALWAVLHERGWVHLGDIAARTTYPVLPWIGVIALGYACGKWFLQETSEHRRRRFLLYAGIASTLAFVVLRLWGGYGEPGAWYYEQGQSLQALMSFLNLTKYPPSLLFLLMTLGPSLLLLRVAEGWSGKMHNIVVTFGRVPFFYYVMHLYTLHLVYRICGLFWGYGWDGMAMEAGIPAKLDVGEIGWVWIISLVTLIILYPLTAWFARLKAEKRSPILSYL